MQSPLYEIFWGCYWILVFASVVISIIAIIKKYFKTGIPSLLLSLGMPVFSFVFALSRDWVGTGEDELAFLWRQLRLGAWQAYFLVIANIVLLVLTIYHILKLIQKKK